MERTRRGRSDQGRESSSQPVDRVCPTASARQRRSRQQVHETQEDVVPDQAQQEDPTSNQAHQWYIWDTNIINTIRHTDIIKNSRPPTLIFIHP
ncbi:hypothetical protein SESBI_00441 [Sesbania bispinosa]|nr:hypothetical protein SESBI_00441 [Sesbania bispinosa]